MKTLCARVENDQIELLDLLALRNGVERSEIVRRFLAAGVAANPIGENEVAILRARRQKGAAMPRPELALPRLVIPMPPPDLVASQESSISDQEGKVRGGRPTPPYVWSDASVLLTDKKHNTRKHLRAA